MDTASIHLTSISTLVGRQRCHGKDIWQWWKIGKGLVHKIRQKGAWAIVSQPSLANFGKKAAVIPKSLPICKNVALGRTKDSIDPWSHGPWFGCCEEENTWGAIVSGLGNRSNLQGIKLTRGIYHYNNVSQRHMQFYCQAVFIPGVKSVRDEAMKKGKKCAEKGKEKLRSCYGLADRGLRS